MITNWNNTVRPNDIVYHLGDFAYGDGSKSPDKYFNRLNGHKHLVIGNHDNKKTMSLPWASVSNYQEISIGKQRVVMLHYAMRVWHHSYRGVWQLYGHSHLTLPEQDHLSFDIGVDGWNYTPVSFEQVKAKMEWKEKNPGYFSRLNPSGTDSEIHNKAEYTKEQILKVNSLFIK